MLCHANCVDFDAATQKISANVRSSSWFAISDFTCALEDKREKREEGEAGAGWACMSSAEAAGPPPAQGGGVEEDVKADAVVGEGAVGAEENPQGGGAGTKRPAEEGDGKVGGEAGGDANGQQGLGVSKRAKAMPIAGGGGKRRVVKLTGLDGLYWDQLDGQLRKWAIPFCNLVKKQMQDTAQLELPDDRPILMGCLRVIDNQAIKGKVIKVDYEGLEDVKPPSAADENEETARGIVRQVAPLFDVEYEDQLAFKRCLLMSSMRQVTVQMHKELVGKGSKGKKGGGGGGGNADDGTVECPKWVWRAHKGPCLDVGEVHRSPALTGYRNKNEFTIGHGPDGKPEVGFRFGKFCDGRKGVGCADACPNIPENALAVARCLKDFIVNHQDMSPWINDDHKGVWRMLLVRSSRAGDIMAMVQYSSNNVEREKLDAGLEKMKHFLLEKVKEGKMRLTCLYGQEHNTVSNKAADDCPLIHMWGEECFYENLLSLRFRISPSAFFQVNTLAAEVLNGLIRDWAAAGTDQVVLDVCCGTGTIGMCIASRGSPILFLVSILPPISLSHSPSLPLSLSPSLPLSLSPSLLSSLPLPHARHPRHVDDKNEIFATLERDNDDISSPRSLRHGASLHNLAKATCWKSPRCHLTCAPLLSLDNTRRCKTHCWHRAVRTCRGRREDQRGGKRH